MPPPSWTAHAAPLACVVDQSRHKGCPSDGMCSDTPQVGGRTREGWHFSRGSSAGRKKREKLARHHQPRDFFGSRSRIPLGGLRLLTIQAIAAPLARGEAIKPIAREFDVARRAAGVAGPPRPDLVPEAGVGGTTRPSAAPAPSSVVGRPTVKPGWAHRWGATPLRTRLINPPNIG